MSPDSNTRTPNTPRGVPLSDQVSTFDISYQLIPPEDFVSLGIDERDVPVGTFVAADHPPFLLSRFGGNAYGLGIVEQRNKLAGSDLDFLERLDFNDPKTLKKHHRRINTIYRKLGLLMRFSRQGKRYFLIPINWVSHSLEDIKDKVDEIERVLIKRVTHMKKEKLSVGLLTGSNDLIVHEISGRMSTHRFVIIDSISKLRQTGGPLDLVIVPKDLDDLLLSLGFPGLAGSNLTQQIFTTYGTYVAGKIYDLLEPSGELFVISSKPFPRANKEVWIEFRNPDESRSFLLFTHVFRSKKRYSGKSGSLLKVNLEDFYNYLSGIFFYREDLKRVVGERDPARLTLEEIDHLPHLDLKISSPKRADLEKRWDKVLAPFFEKITGHSKQAPSLKENWEKNYIVEGEPPDNLQVYMGRKRKPPVLLEQLEQQERASGMAGCSLSLVADYKNGFDYLFSVLQVLEEIREKRFARLPELHLNRLYNPFAAPKNRYRAFKHIKELMKRQGRLPKFANLLNPDQIEGSRTKVLENVEKLALLGLSPPLLREIYLIVVGHTTMGRITFGKLPEKTLKSITDQARRLSLEEIADLLRIIRLLSMAEIAASLGNNLTREQGKELFNLYDQAVWIAADPHLDWETLHDQQIAALGGAQNLAVRQMLKLFNLFEHLDSWTELTHMGPFQKEARASYKEEKLAQIDQALELIKLTNEFKECFYGTEAISRPYFFRKLLNCQFHGTGRLLPMLGTRAGFVLLWITINSSPGNVINFNPLVRYGPQDSDDRNQRVKRALESLQPEELHFSYLAGIKKTLSQGRAAFIFDTGIQLHHNPLTQATEVIFIDIMDNLRRMDLILQSAGERFIPEIPVAELKEIDRLFRELYSYHEHLQRHPGRTGMDDDLLARQKMEISRYCARVELLFAQKLFVPQRLFDTLEILHQHCPNIGRRILSEFWQLYRIQPTQRIHAGETIPGYVLRCLKKFQALLNKEREALQNTEIFYQLAQQQFGAMTGEAIGISNMQIDILEAVVDRIKTRPRLLGALCGALIFQEIGKLPLYFEEYRSISTNDTHGLAGAGILRRQAVLQRFGMDEEMSGLAGFLVEVHGLIGHALRGEVALPALATVTTVEDKLVFEAFFIHSVLAAAAYREGTMVEDLLDRFLHLRQVGLDLINGESSWQTYMELEFIEKGRNLLAETKDTTVEQGSLELFSDWGKLTGTDGFRRKGEEVAALERLFRLVGFADINFVDVQMKMLGMPGTFIYHKKGLKSTGLQKFEEELSGAMTVYHSIMGLDEEIRRDLLFKLSPGQDLVRIFGLEYVAHHLLPKNCLKLLILAFRVIDNRSNDKPWVVDFQDLGQTIDRRYQSLAEELTSMSSEQLFRDGRLLSRLSKGWVGLILTYSRKERVVKPLYRDRLQIKRVLDRLRAQEDISRLKNVYHRQLKRLRNHDTYTEDYQKQLSETFHGRLQELIELAFKNAQRKIRRQRKFSGIERVFAELMTLTEENALSEEQLQMVKDMYEFRRDRLRNLKLERIYRDINGCGTTAALLDCWNQIRTELVRNRRHLGKEFENLVTKRFDQQLARLTED